MLWTVDPASLTGAVRYSAVTKNPEAVDKFSGQKKY